MGAKVVLLLSLGIVLLGCCNEERRIYVPGEVLVKFKSNTPNNKIHALNKAINVVSVKEINHEGLQVIKLPHNISVKEAIKYYEKDPNVEYAEPNYIVRKP